MTRATGYQGCLLFIALVFWLATSLVAHADPLIEQQQSLNFGTLALSSNASVSRITYPRTGVNVSIEGQFVLIGRGSTGLYQLTGFPANTSLTISINTATLTAVGNGTTEPLSVDSYDFAELVTDAEGAAELTLGARLSTTGNGIAYEDAFYSGATTLRVEYYQPDVQQFVFNSKTIDLEVALQSTLTIDQEQKLSFGSLFARSSNTSQAIITVAPSGLYEISEPDDSRLVSLVKPQYGILRVSGAAPNYSLTITPQVADVLLQHSESPEIAPHFILSELTTSPDGEGVTDTNGELLINIGGTLKTELTASPTNYPNGEYEGTYELTVSY